MKKKIKNNKIPAYMFGMFAQIGQAVEGLGEGLKQNGQSGLGQAIAGAANPAKAGLQYLGNNDVSFGNKLLAFTGLGSIFAQNQAEKARKRREEQTKSTQMGLNNAASMEQEYWQNNQSAYTFQNGGVLPDLAYLDNNEVIRDDYGNILNVPNTTNGTDEHLVDSSNLESVLSDKIKRPSTGKTFAQEAKILSKMTKPSKGNDAFAQNTDRLNKMNANIAYNNLLAEQESIKAKKGIKNKEKSLPTFAKGGKLNLPEAPMIPMGMMQDPTINPLPIYDNKVRMPQEATTRLAAADRSLSQNANKSNGIGNFSNAISSVASLAPTLYNMFQGMNDPEQESVTFNPYISSINRTMAKRRINIEPTLSANRRARSISNYNLAKLNPNTGMNLAARTQMAAGEYAQNADLYATRDNSNNAYLGEYANMLNNLGQQFVQGQTLTNDINARNRAASRNYGATAASQIGQWAQVQQQMSNQRRNDDMMLPFLGNFLSYGQTSSAMQDFYNKYGRR